MAIMRMSSLHILIACGGIGDMAHLGITRIGIGDGDGTITIGTSHIMLGILITILIGITIIIISQAMWAVATLRTMLTLTAHRAITVQRLLHAPIAADWLPINRALLRVVP